MSNEQHSSAISKIFFSWAGNYIKYIEKLDNEISSMEIPTGYSIGYNKDKFIKYTPHKFTSKKDIVYMIFYIFKNKFILYSLLSMISVFLGYTSPILFPKMITIMQDNYNSDNRWIILVAVFSITQILYAIFKSQFTHMKWKLIIAIEYNFKNFLFQKILFQSINENDENNGQAVNFYSSYTSSLRGFVWFFDFIANILGLLVGIALLYGTMGQAGLLSGGIFILVFPCVGKIYEKLNIYEESVQKSNEKRISLLTELVMKIRTIRLSNFTEYFQNKMHKQREEQLHMLKKQSKGLIITGVIQHSLVALITAVSLTLASLCFKIQVTSAMIIETFLILDIMDGLISQSFVSMDAIRSCKKSLDFIVTYCNKFQQIESDGIADGISLENVSFSFKGEKILNNINFKIRKWELAVISGERGAGKSVLLDIIFQKRKAEEGSILVNKTITLINNDNNFLPTSIKNNVILDKEYDKGKFYTIMNLVFPDKEFERFPHKYDTVLVGNAANISGGQAVRLQIARAAYQNPDIILIDDVLNSIDHYNREHIIKEIILKLWKDRALIIVTNNYKLKNKADFLYEMCEGSLKPGLREDTKAYQINENKENNKERINVCEESTKYSENKNKKISNSDVMSKKSLLIQYLQRLSNKKGIILFIILFSVAQLIDLGIRVIVSNKDSISHDVISFSGLYCGLVGLLVLSNAIRYAIVYFGNIKAGNTYYNELVSDILNVNYLNYKDGYIKKALTIGTNDIRTFDNSLADFFINIFESVILLEISVFLLLFFNWKSIFLIVPYFVFFWKGQKRSTKVTERVVKMCNSSNEPCINLINTTRKGSKILQGFGAGKCVYDEWLSALTNAQSFEYTRQAINRYELLKIDILSVVLIAIFLAASYITHSEAELTMVILSYLLTIRNKFESMMRDIRHSEIGIDSLSRLNSLKVFRIEEEQMTGDERIINNSVLHPVIEVKNLSCSYDEDGYVLKNINLTVDKGSHVLLQGKSGVGKTTFFNCIMRLIEYNGDIFIDGYNNKSFVKEELRKKIFVLTQENAIFSGSVKENLNPYQIIDDIEIMDAVKIFGLNDVILDKEANTLSDSEKRMLCLVRAYLQKAQILLIDEGIINNRDSDLTIGEMIFNIFPESTVICISHIESSKYFDKVISFI